jgi:hypothetical protein
LDHLALIELDLVKQRSRETKIYGAAQLRDDVRRVDSEAAVDGAGIRAEGFG